MAYDEPEPRGSSASFSSSSFPVSDFSSDAEATTVSLGRRTDTTTSTTASLEDVFDDPDHGEPGRDRLGVHLVWELLLLLAVGTLGYLVWHAQPAVLRGDGLRDVLVDISAFGLIALGVGISLRTAAPNLAAGPVAMAAGVFFAENGDNGVLPVTGTVALAALALGAAVAVLTVGLHVPGWAASLAGALVAVVWLQQHLSTVEVSGEYRPQRQAYLLAGGFVAVAVLGGLIGSIKSVRRAVGRFRPVADPARRRGGTAAGLTALALVASMVLSAVGGVILAAGRPDRQIAPTLGLELTGLALGAVLLGGTSAFGRRGGIFGTVFAVTLLVLFIRYDAIENWRISPYALAAAMVGGGLVVTRLVEALGRPRTGQDDAEEASSDLWPASTTSTSSSWSTRSDPWSSSLPAQPSSTRTADLWSDDRWGSRG